MSAKCWSVLVKSHLGVACVDVPNLGLWLLLFDATVLIILFLPRSIINVCFIVKRKMVKMIFVQGKSLCHHACSAHAHCMTWCSLASAFFFFFFFCWWLFFSRIGFRKEIKHGHARKDCCFCTFWSRLKPKKLFNVKRNYCFICSLFLMNIMDSWISFLWAKLALD